MRAPPAGVLFAACCAGLLAVAGLQRRMPRAAELEPFDSNLPVQWDSSAEVGGLSRYFNSPSAGLGRAPEGHLALRQRQARLVQLAQLPARSARSPPRLGRAQTEMRRADRALRRAQAGMHAVIGGAHLAARRRGARGRQQMLMGIGGWGSGEESDNEGTWEVAMRTDSGCEDTLELRRAGNPGWRRQVQNKCDPNKVQNPMMWPFDKPGAVWTHDSVDTSRDPDRFPFNTEALHDDVYAAEETPAFADGVWHRASNQGSFRREYTKKAR